MNTPEVLGLEPSHAPAGAGRLDGAVARLTRSGDMLRGGLDNGRWCVFLDGRKQQGVYGKMEDEALPRVIALSVRERGCL